MNMNEIKSNWRDDAVNEALRGFDNAEYREAMLREIRLAHPDAATLLFSPDRLRLMDFLSQHDGGARSLLVGTVDGLDGRGAPPRPFAGWWEVSWEGETVEIALPPATYDGVGVVLIGRNSDSLSRLAWRVLDFTERPSGRCLRYTQGWEDARDLDAEIGKVTWDDVVLPPALLADVREAVEGFFAHKAAYAALGFAWKRGVLLVGPPGTGKTMLCKAVASAVTDLPFLYVRDLSEAHGQREAIKTIFERARTLAPCVLAFEDIDGMVSAETGNRTVFLNELDGFESNDGLLIIASSNHPGKIDEALLKRPSRFDRVFHIGLPGPDERAEFCRRLLSRSSLTTHLSPTLDIETLARAVSERTDGFTPAYLKEAFIAAALSRAQAGAFTLDDTFGAAVLSQADELREHLKRMRDPDALAEMTTADGMGFRK